jgi:hypothetical protein
MCIVAGCVARAGTAGAEEPTRAATLFEQGRQLFDEGRVDEACSTLAESDRLEPAVGTIGLLAACHEKQNKLGTAYREYLETADRAAKLNDERGAFARRRAEELSPRVPRLQVVLPEGVPGMTVTRDGAPQAAAELRTGLVLDPGNVELGVQAPGYQPRRARIVVVEGRTVLHLAELTPVAAPPVPAPAPPPSPERARPLGARFPYVVGAAVVAGAGAAVGGALGGSAYGKNQASERIQTTCAGAPDECAEGRALREDAATEATASTVAFAVAGAAAAAGIVIFVTDPSRGAPPRSGQRLDRPRARGAFLAPAPAGVALRGAF